MSYNYTTLQSALAAAMVQAESPYTTLPPNFVTLLPRAIEYAEARIYRELVLLATQTQDSSLQTVVGQKYLPPLSTMSTPCIVVEGVSLSVLISEITFNGQPITFHTDPILFSESIGGSYVYDKSNLSVVDSSWSNQIMTMSPQAATWVGRYWALVDNNTIVLSPTPDGIYAVTITGLFQPTPLSALNPTTYLATQYPELMLAACMVWLAGGLTRNFGAQADEPKFAMSWETQYQMLLASASDEEHRRRGMAPNMPKMAQPQAQPVGGH